MEPVRQIVNEWEQKLLVQMCKRMKPDKMVDYVVVLHSRPGQGKSNNEKDGAKAVIAGNLSRLNNTVTGAAPRLEKVYHSTDHVLVPLTIMQKL